MKEIEGTGSIPEAKELTPRQKQLVEIIARVSLGILPNLILLFLERKEKSKV